MSVCRTVISVIFVVLFANVLILSSGCPPITDDVFQPLLKAAGLAGCRGCEPAPQEGEGEPEGEPEGEQEGETPGEGEGTVEGESEGEAPAEGEGETPAEGEGETPAEGEGEYEGPEANFGGAPREGQAPLTVQFTDSSAAGSAAIMSFAWDFGDGGTSAERNPSHTYETPGLYDVSLTTTTSVGSDTRTKTEYILVEEPPLIDLQLVKWGLEKGPPNYVNILYQALGADSVGVTDLERANFRLLEDGGVVSQTESNTEIRKQDRLPYTFYTVLMLDNSASVGANLPQIKNAAKTLVDSMGAKQRIAIYSFSSTVQPLREDFTGIEDQQALRDAIDGMQLGFPTTNLYGAVVEGVTKWTDRYQLDGVSQGALVLFTDGSDTTSTATLQQAVNARGAKRCYTIGLGDEINPEALQNLGNAGYYPLADFTELAATFAIIQENIDLYVDSFYLLRYNSPKRGNFNRTLSLFAVPPYQSNTLTGDFNSRDFYDVMPGLYVNDGYHSHNGVSELVFDQGPGQQRTLNVHSYFGNTETDPVYICDISDETILEVVSNEVVPNEGGVIIVEALRHGETTLIITDTVNGFSRTLDVVVWSIVPDVYDLPESAAVAAIEAAGLTVGEITYVVNDEVASGNVLEQSITTGTPVALETAIDLTVARYTVVPDVYDLPEADAIAALEAAGLTVGEIIQRYSTDIADGNSMGTTPVAGTAVAPGSEVAVIVSLGEPTVGTEYEVMLPGNVALVLVWIPAGSFVMGRYSDEQDSNSSEDPQHEVTVSQGFWMGKYEVTNEQYNAVVDYEWPEGEPEGEGESKGESKNDLRPISDVSWYLAQHFIALLNDYITHTGQGPAVVRLPTEAEWEYAYRAGTTTRFYWGDDPSHTQIGDYAWYSGNNSPSGTKNVGQKLPNAWGLYDMSGNVWEWCEDDWHSTYTGAPTDGSAWVDSPRGSNRLLRGGSWGYYAYYCRAAGRAGYTPGAWVGFNYGFRVVCASD